MKNVRAEAIKNTKNAAEDNNISSTFAMILRIRKDRF